MKVTHFQADGQFREIETEMAKPPIHYQTVNGG